MQFVAIVLAAGKGTRMNSSIPKVLHRVGGKTMLSHVLQQAYDAGAKTIIVVTGYGASSVEEEAQNWQKTVENVALHFALQSEQLGTGHAVQQAAKLLNRVANAESLVAVLCGDVPLLQSSTIKALAEKHTKENAACTVLTVVLPNPTGFGRIVRIDSEIAQIVEERDCKTDAERKISEVNAGCYVFQCGALCDVLQRIDNRNAQNEYYLTDTVRLLVAQKSKVVAVFHDGDVLDCLGVNTVEQLKTANESVSKHKHS